MPNVQAKKGKRVVTIPSPFNIDVTDDGKVNVDISHPSVAALIASGDLVVVDAVTAPTSPTNKSYGTLAQMPAASSMPDKSIYYAMDDNGGTAYQVQSNAWVKVSPGVLETGGRELGRAQSTFAGVLQNAAGNGTRYDVAGLSKAIVVGARSIFIEAYIPDLYTTVVNCPMAAYIYEGATLLGMAQIFNPAVGSANGQAINPKVPLNPSTGSHTYNVKVSSGLGGNIGMFADPTLPAFIRITEG